VKGQWQTVRLTDVWYVPKIRRNLLSITATQDRNENSSFVSTSRMCHLTVNDKVVAVGTRSQRGGLFKLIAKTVIPQNSDAEVNVVSNESTLQLYHERLGHQNKRHVRMVIKRELNIDVDIDSELCDGCVYGKMHRLKFGTRVRATKSGELIHADVCGPFCSSFSNYRYFVLFKDDYSGYRFVYFLKAKSEVSEKLEQMLAEAKATGKIVSEFLSDNGGEFDCAEVKSILQKNGIRQRFTMPYTPQQNGSSEHENRTLVEAARAMRLAHGELPLALWAELINTAAYIMNRTAPSSVEGKSSYELWFDKKPQIKHLRIIGCNAYVHIPVQKRKKLDKKAEKGILVGYEGDDGYRIFVSKGNKMYRSRDVIFDEKVIEPNSHTSSNWPMNVSLNDQKTEESINQENDGGTENNRSSISADEIETDVNNQGDEGMQLRDRNNVHKPTRFDDYVMMTALSESCEPDNFEEAVLSNNKEEWLKAIYSEMQSLKENQTWVLENLPSGRKAIPCKWIYKVKYNSDGKLKDIKPD
jgi:transposase InsO family protein